MNTTISKFHATSTKAFLWVSGDDRAWFRDFFKADLDRDGNTITYTWPEWDENDNMIPLTATIKLTDEQGNLDLATMYTNAAKVFQDKAAHFAEMADNPEIKPDGRACLLYHAENMAVIADMYAEALYFETGKELAA